MKKAKSGIYGIYCSGSGKWYVGSGKNIKTRIDEHMRNCRHDQKMSKVYEDWDFRYKGNMGRDYVKHGSRSFSFHLLESVSDTKLFPERENYWMGLKDSRSNGYNHQSAGNHRSW